MTDFRYIPDSVITERHRAARKPAGPMPAPRLPVSQATTRNVRPVLDLGATRYMTFRNQVIGVPPLPFQDGHRLLNLYTRTLALATQMTRGGDRATTDEYYDNLSRIASLLWSLSFPTGKFARFLRAIGGYRNPFRKGTERDILEATDFFLRSRTKSTIKFESTTPAGSEMSMHSMNFRSS